MLARHSRPAVTAGPLQLVGSGLAVHLQPSTNLPQALVASRRLRQAGAQARYARRDPSSLSPLMRECKKARIGLEPRVGPCGIAQLTITHIERADAKLRYALEQQQTAIATVLLLRAGGQR